MGQYIINLNWKKESAEFTYEKLNRNHVLHFSGNQTLKNSAAPEYFGNPDMTNPEELLASATASCHMLTFLAVAAKMGFVVESYDCKAEALMGKNAEGRFSVTEINLTPKIVFSGDKTPTQEQLKGLHEKAHRNCFIAQSLQSKVNVL
nr:OsmC family protein [Bacteriovorax sp. HI3]